MYNLSLSQQFLMFAVNKQGENIKPRYPNLGVLRHQRGD